MLRCTQRHQIGAKWWEIGLIQDSSSFVKAPHSIEPCSCLPPASVGATAAAATINMSLILGISIPSAIIIIIVACALTARSFFMEKWTNRALLKGNRRNIVVVKVVSSNALKKK